MKKVLSVALLLTLFFGLTAIAASKSVPRVPGYTDHITITLNSYETGVQLLNIQPGDLTITPTGCVNGQSCSFNIQGAYGEAAITVGSDWQHYCQFYIEDGALIQDPDFYQNPNCIGGHGSDSQITQDHGYYYHIHMW